MNDLVAALQRIVFSTPWLVDILRVVRDVGPPDAHVGAGVIRNTVWDCLDEAHRVVPVADVDVVYFHPLPPGTPQADQWALRLRCALPGYRWDVTNQATVHYWQSRQLGRRISPYRSLEAAIASWPETATALAVKLSQAGALTTIAPYGLRDLFELRLRPSPGAKDTSAYLARLQQKNWKSRWPRLTVQDDDLRISAHGGHLDRRIADPGVG